jgi:gliding motility-associated protein GldC
MKQSSIEIQVGLDPEKVPTSILWKATDSNIDVPQPARAMMLSFWDAAEKSALRIDLWTKEMMVDEMGDFFFQTLMGMAETLQRSTGQQQLADDMQVFARDFFRRFRDGTAKQ